MATLGTASAQHRSFWRDRLASRSRGRALQEHLIREANLRGFLGAYGPWPLEGERDAELRLEDIVVGLLMPHAPAEGRVLKLVLRILQSGKIDADHLCWLARKERADDALWWLLAQLPAEERNEPVRQLTAKVGGAPRGWKPPAYRYEPQRLVRRPFVRGETWPTRRS